MAEAMTSSWLLETIVSFLRSPSYKAPMMEFIDTHCDVFTGDEENKFEHSTLHQAYVELSMSLIESFLHEIGVSQEVFASACDEGIKRGGAEAAVFSQIIAADDFLTFKRMMHARSASLDFQAHLQYEKIRNSALPGAAAAAMETYGQQVVSRDHVEHQHRIQQHQLQSSESSVAPSTSGSSPRNTNPTHSADSDESHDSDERMLQQAIELSKLAFEEMRSQAQQEEADFESAIRLSILEAAEHSRRLQKEQQDALPVAASSASQVASSQSDDSWQMELEAARLREQEALLSFAIAQQQAVAKMEIDQVAPSAPLNSTFMSSANAASLPIPQSLPDVSSRSSTLPRLGALPPLFRGSRLVSDNVSPTSNLTDFPRSSSPPATSSEISGAGLGSKMDPLEIHKRKQHLENLRDQIRQREQQERRQALADSAVASSSAPLNEAQLQQRRELAERLKSL